MTERYIFVVVENDLAPPDMRFQATLGDYDEGSPVGSGPTPAEAITEWLASWGDALEAS